jgi:hypothetical protein
VVGVVVVVSAEVLLVTVVSTVSPPALQAERVTARAMRKTLRLRSIVFMSVPSATNAAI